MTLKAFIDRNRDWIVNRPVVQWAVRQSKRIVIPGFEGVSLYEVTTFFYRGATQGYLTGRAAAVSYSVFLAIFPFLILLFSIIPFIPIDNFQAQLLIIISDFMPRMAYESVKETIVDIVTRPRSGVLILNLLLTLYFSTNGVNSLIAAFNSTYHEVDTRPQFRQYMVSVMIVFILAFLLILTIGLITFGHELLSLFIPDFIEKSGFYYYLLEAARWLVVLALLLTAISSIYYLAPSHKGRFRFLSAGSLLATFLIVITTLGFNYWVDNFSRYNALYGSLGTLMIVLVWIYINAISLLIGFELNASIRSAKSGPR
jgi:membrane protein